MYSNFGFDTTIVPANVTVGPFAPYPIGDTFVRAAFVGAAATAFVSRISYCCMSLGYFVKAGYRTVGVMEEEREEYRTIGSEA
jgi:hypothetical protein